MRIQILSFGIALAMLGHSNLLAQETKPQEKKTEEKKPAEKAPADQKAAPAKPTWTPFAAIQQFKIVAAIDEDLDGTVTMKEMETAVERITKLDTNGDGKLSAEEFLKEGKVPSSVLTFGVVKGLDADKNGELSADEIKVAVDVLKKLDANKNNRLESMEYAMKSPMGMGVSSDSPAASGGGGGGGGRQMPTPEEFMKQNDKNSDGKVEKSELTGPAANFFDRMDENKDGGISLEEVKASRERMRQQNGGPGGGGGGGGRGGRGGGPGGAGGAAGEKPPETPKTDAPKTDPPK